MLQEKINSQTDHLEGLFKKYRDVPKEVIVKEDLLRVGFHLSRKTIDSCAGEMRKVYQLFSWDFTKVEKMGGKDVSVLFPDTIEIIGGIYQLRRIVVRPRINMDSPYSINLIENKLELCDRDSGSPIAELLPFRPVPGIMNKSFEDGTLYREVGPINADFIIFRQCQYWGPSEECKFCDINRNAAAKKKLGQVKTLQPKKVEHVAKWCEDVFFSEDVPIEDRPISVHLNGGSITQSLQGLPEFEFYIQFVDAIRERIGTRWPIVIQTGPWPIEQEKEAAKRVNICRLSNYEVWDKDLFKIICPGKSKSIGRDQWHKGILDQVEIFGEGAACPGFVCGVEMAQPFGFKTVEEAVKSSTEGMEFFMSRGAVVRPISWCVEALSDLPGQQPPPVDYYIQIDRNWFELWSKYKLPPVKGFPPIGPGLNLYPNSASFDMGVV